MPLPMYMHMTTPVQNEGQLRAASRIGRHHMYTLSQRRATACLRFWADGTGDRGCKAVLVRERGRAPA